MRTSREAGHRPRTDLTLRRNRQRKGYPRLLALLLGGLFLAGREGKGFHAAGFMAVLRSSFKKDRTKIPTIYVTLSNVSAVANPVLSIR